jgi:hypothetical protein
MDALWLAYDVTRERLLLLSVDADGAQLDGDVSGFITGDGKHALLRTEHALVQEDSSDLADLYVSDIAPILDAAP